MDDDVSHAVDARLTRLEQHAGLPPIGEDVEEPVEPEEKEDDEEEVDAEEEAD